MDGREALGTPSSSRVYVKSASALAAVIAAAWSPFAMGANDVWTKPYLLGGPPPLDSGTSMSCQ